MVALFVLSALLVLYGTLYPFEIVHTAHLSDILPRFLQSLHQRPGRGDVLSNVILFLPFGFFGMQALLQRAPRIARLTIVCILGAALSFSIECMQTFVVGRYTSVFDLVLNSFGTFVGACAGWIDWNRRLADGIKSHRPPSLFPVLLIGAWLAYRLFPYVPTIDFQHVKDAIKPLLTGDIVPLDVLRHFIVCLVVGRLLQALLTPSRALQAMPVVVLGVIAAKPFLMTRVMNLSEIIGAIAAIVLWTGVLARLNVRTIVLALLLAAQVTIQGTLPFTPAAHPATFSFIPFKGFEGGSMAINLQVFLEKVFLYGSLIWLQVQSKMKLGTAIAVTVVLLASIELVQTQLEGRISEITDPLLALIMGGVLYALERSQRAAPATARAGARV
jgi:glycopeptide antibiotics resistance protein